MVSHDMVLYEIVWCDINGIVLYGILSCGMYCLSCDRYGIVIDGKYCIVLYSIVLRCIG